MMAISFVPTLEHLCSAKIITLLLDNPEICGKWRILIEAMRLKVKEDVSNLIPCAILRTKLENFITPIACEVENWVNETGFQITSPTDDAIRLCWLSDGTIDREKSIKLLLKRSDVGVNLVRRFCHACTYCIFDDVLALWKHFYKIEMAYVRHKGSPTVKLWVEWLESNSNKDWESFITWTLKTPFWNCNRYLLKNVLRTVSPVEKSECLLKALTGSEVRCDVISFVLTIMSRHEREVVFRESPLKVVKCFLCWPLRNLFFDAVEALWPYVSEDTFCCILKMILSVIFRESIEHVEFVAVLKTFWAQSPGDYKKAAEKDNDLIMTLNFVLKYDFTLQTNKIKFITDFWYAFPHLAPMRYMKLDDYLPTFLNAYKTFVHYAQPYL